MSHTKSKFPYFISSQPRSLSAHEVAILKRLTEGQPKHFVEQTAHLEIVGRCGCGACPTVFFLACQKGGEEADLATMAGKDSTGGLTAAVLMHKAGMLSQLEFYSVDGHDPWDMPSAESLEPW